MHYQVKCIRGSKRVSYLGDLYQNLQPCVLLRLCKNPLRVLDSIPGTLDALLRILDSDATSVVVTRSITSFEIRRPAIILAASSTFSRMTNPQ